MCQGRPGLSTVTDEWELDDFITDKIDIVYVNNGQLCFEEDEELYAYPDKWKFGAYPNRTALLCVSSDIQSLSSP